MLLFSLLVCCGLAVMDPCALVAQTKVASYHEALACYNHFKMSAIVKESTIQTLKKTLPLLSQPHINITILTKHLDSIDKESFLSEFKFQSQLVQVFSHQGMHYDAGCFSSFNFHLPIELVVVEEEGIFVVRVSSFLSYLPALQYHWHAIGIDPARFRERRVTKINQVDAFDYLEEYMGPTINDATARLVHNDGFWEVNPGSFALRSTTPQEDAVTFEFDYGEVAVIPFLVTVPPGFNDSISFYSMCTQKFSKPTEIPVKRHTNLVQLSKNKAVLSISSFDESPIWEQEITRALNYINKHSINELILDLRDSGGDYICGGYSLINYFRPRKIRPCFPLILPNSSLIQKLSAACLYPNFHCKKKPAFVKEFKCKTSFLKHSTNPKPKLPSIRILTNGICTGACSILIHGLVEAGVPGVYFVGVPDRNSPIGKMGTPYSLNKLWEDLEHSNLSSEPDAPPRFLTAANLHFNLGTTYKSDYNGLRPLEKVLPGKVFQMSDSESLFLDPLYLWNLILGINGTYMIPSY